MLNAYAYAEALTYLFNQIYQAQAYLEDPTAYTKEFIHALELWRDRGNMDRVERKNRIDQLAGFVDRPILEILANGPFGDSNTDGYILVGPGNQRVEAAGQ